MIGKLCWFGSAYRSEDAPDIGVVALQVNFSELPMRWVESPKVFKRKVFNEPADDFLNTDAGGLAATQKSFCMRR